MTRALSTGAAALAGVAFVLMAVNIIVDVTGRYLFNRPMTGTLELTANVWMPVATAFAMALALQRHEHLRVTLVVDRVSPRVRSAADRLTAAVVALVVAGLTYFTYLDATYAASIRQASTGPVPVPIWLVKLTLVGAMALFTAQAIAAVFEPQGPHAAHTPGAGDAGPAHDTGVRSGSR